LLKYTPAGGYAKNPFHGGELVYCDPPYLHSTRRDPGLYRYEMADHQHEALLAVLLRLPCLACISGYWSALYAETLSTWRVCFFQAQTRRGVVTEYLWCNYPAPTALHDDRYLGKDFRERERIKRMKARWVKRLNQSTRDSYTRCPRRTDITRLCVLPVCQCCVV
jgi:hypothetical protein